jgi:uncharacterized phiE125 gp8 family phage protein
MSGLKVIAAPIAEPISLELARLHLRLDVNDDSPPTHPDDPWLNEIGIPAAREWCEGWMERAIGPQTLELALDAFPSGAIELPGSPVNAIDSVKYVDSDGVDQTLAADQYTLDNYVDPALLSPAYGTSWPAARATTNTVRVRYSAGYTLPGESPDAAPLPFAIRAAMLLVLGALYENRENSAAVKQEDVPLGARSLLQPYRLRTSMA